MPILLNQHKNTKLFLTRHLPQDGGVRTTQAWGLAGPVGLEGGRERLDFGMARCATPYGAEDLSPGTTLEPVCEHVLTVTGT